MQDAVLLPNQNLCQAEGPREGASYPISSVLRITTPPLEVSKMLDSWHPMSPHATIMQEAQLEATWRTLHFLSCAVFAGMWQD